MIVILCCIGYFIGVILTTLLCTKLDIINNDNRVMLCWLWVIGIPMLIFRWIGNIPDRLYYKLTKFK